MKTYVDYNAGNPRCIHCFISDRAYSAIISEVIHNGANETGGVLIGHIHNRVWYIVDVIDAGIDTTNRVALFQWDREYVNHLIATLSRIYRIPLTVLGFYHRHPGDMNFFSGQDEDTISQNLRHTRLGLLSMLVNIDPKLRMTFYYCYDNDIMKIGYDVGDCYFPREFLQYADAKELERRASAEGNGFEIYYKPVISKESYLRTPSESDNGP